MLVFLIKLDFAQDDNGTLCISATKYISERVIKSHDKMFGGNLKKNILSPLETDNHPEIDTCELLGELVQFPTNLLLHHYNRSRFWGDMILVVLS